MKMKKKREKVRGEGGCVQRMEVILKRKKSQGGGWEGQGRYERRSEVFVKIKKKIFFLGGGGGGGGAWGRVWGGGGGVRVDVN